MATMTLLTRDGVRISAAHIPGVDGERDIGIVVAHGFMGSWKRPDVWRIVRGLTRVGGVVCFDFRGHGGSGGRSTLGDREVLDLDTAVRYARSLGYSRIVAVGFSLGGGVVVRYAGLIGGLAAVASVSAPARWSRPDNAALRRMHWAIRSRAGRLMTRSVMRTRIGALEWDPVPETPVEVVGRIAPTPLLIVHGDRDAYFPLDHARDLYAAAGDPKELWIEHGYGHAEKATDAVLVQRVGAWVREAVGG